MEPFLEYYKMTPSLLKAITKPLNVKSLCGKCGFMHPSTPGRYAKNCPLCGHEHPIVKKSEETNETLNNDDANLTMKHLVQDWFSSLDHNPTDEEVHKFAEDNGIEKDKVEETIYQIAKEHVG